MKRMELEVFSDATNLAVVRMPGRQFPGLVMQGDSLASLASSIRAASEALAAGNIAEAGDELQNLSEEIDTYLRAYESVLASVQMKPPY